MSILRPFLVVLLGVLAVHAPPPAQASDAGGTTRAVTDFTDATPDLGWTVVNDGVMGGRSEGGFERAGDALDFAGTTNTDGGGFSSIRTRGLELDLSGYDGIRVRVRGDGRRYTWRLTTDARWRGRQVGYWADFATVKGEWTVADIPFSAFRPQWRGRMLDGPELDPGRIRGMGLMIYDKQDGPFALRLDRVDAYRAPAPFSLEGERWTSRVLVVSAARADDQHLVRQLADVEATRAAFAERDMLLVVLLDGPGSRAGDRALSSDEVRAVRHEAGIEGSDFALRLVGKDGGVKRSESGAASMQVIYDQIDSMPMRRSEMSR